MPRNGDDFKSYSSEIVDGLESVASVTDEEDFEPKPKPQNNWREGKLFLNSSNSRTISRRSNGSGQRREGSGSDAEGHYDGYSAQRFGNGDVNWQSDASDAGGVNFRARRSNNGRRGIDRVSSLGRPNFRRPTQRMSDYRVAGDLYYGPSSELASGNLGHHDRLNSNNSDNSSLRRNSGGVFSYPESTPAPMRNGPHSSKSYSSSEIEHENRPIFLKNNKGSYLVNSMESSYESLGYSDSDSGSIPSSSSHDSDGKIKETDDLTSSSDSDSLILPTTELRKKKFGPLKDVTNTTASTNTIDDKARRSRNPTRLKKDKIEGVRVRGFSSNQGESNFFDQSQYYPRSSILQGGQGSVDQFNNSSRGHNDSIDHDSFITLSGSNMPIKDFSLPHPENNHKITSKSSKKASEDIYSEYGSPHDAEYSDSDSISNLSYNPNSDKTPKASGVTYPDNFGKVLKWASGVDSSPPAIPSTKATDSDTEVATKKNTTSVVNDPIRSQIKEVQGDKSSPKIDISRNDLLVNGGAEFEYKDKKYTKINQANSDLLQIKEVNDKGVNSTKNYYANFGKMYFDKLDFRQELFMANFRNCVFKDCSFENMDLKIFNTINFHPNCQFENVRIPFSSKDGSKRGGRKVIGADIKKEADATIVHIKGRNEKAWEENQVHYYGTSQEKDGVTHVYHHETNNNYKTISSIPDRLGFVKCNEDGKIYKIGRAGLEATNEEEFKSQVKECKEKNPKESMYQGSGGYAEVVKNAQEKKSAEFKRYSEEYNAFKKEKRESLLKESSEKKDESGNPKPVDKKVIEKELKGLMNDFDYAYAKRKEKTKIDDFTKRKVEMTDLTKTTKRLDGSNSFYPDSTCEVISCHPLSPEKGLSKEGHSSG